MKSLTLGVVTVMLVLTSCNKRSYNTTSSASGVADADFVLATDPNPDAMNDYRSLANQDSSDFVLANDSTPDADLN